MTADGEAEDAAWKASDDYRQKGIYVIYVLFEEKSKYFLRLTLFG